MSEYIVYLKELFSAWGEVEMRPMFGGHGVYFQGLMFAFIAADVLYLKTDKTLALEYERKGLKAFCYNKKNKIIKLSYYQAPEEALEDPDELIIWTEKSFDVALKTNT